jgi:subtilisin-like proprotein convertase family protein
VLHGIVVASILLAAGCGGGSGDDGGFGGGAPGGDGDPSAPSDTSPATGHAGGSSTSSGSGSSGSTGSGGGGVSVAPVLTISAVSAPQDIQPGETNNITWQTTANAVVTETELVWGTVSGIYSNTVVAQSTVNGVSSGTQPWVATFTAPESQGTVYYEIIAKDALGESVQTEEASISVVWVTPTGAQVFAAAPGQSVSSADANGVNVPIVVGAQGTVATVFVRVDIAVPHAGDLAISLQSPSGATARLQVASTDPTPNVFGTFGDTLTPTDSLALFAGTAMQGTWDLLVVDHAAGDVAVIQSASLLIQTQAPASAGESLPDLAPVPPYALSIANIGSGRVISFSNTVQNLGDGPLEFRGVTDATTGVLQCVQRIYSAIRTASGALEWQVVRDVPVGTMFFTDYSGVPRYHLDGFARYVLMDSSFNTLETTDKVSYCVDDGGLAYQDPSLPNYSADRVYWCGMQMQGISVGHADTYAGGCAQELLVTNQPDGVYYLVSEATTIFQEKDNDKINNNAATKIQLTGNTVTVLATYDGAAFAALQASAGK